MPTALLFDVNETLLNLAALDSHFERLFGSSEVRSEWFLQVLQLALVATVTGRYRELARHAESALEMVAARRDRTLSAEDRRAVLEGMRRLPPHPEVPGALERLRSHGFRLAALTNSTREMAAAQLNHSGLHPFFERVFSADSVRRLKPAREPYEMAARELRLLHSETWLVAAHGWDVAGAQAAGCRTAFVARPGKVLDPYAPAPDLIGGDLDEVASRLIERESRTPS